jgi:hypothetical protein
MRLIPVVLAALILLMSGPAHAQEQEWIEYVSQQDFFSVNFPSQPQITDITYATEYGISLPGRVYSAVDGKNRYSVTVVDFAPGEKIHAERSKACTGYPDTCGNRFRIEMRGAMDYAAWSLMQKAAKVTHYAFYNTDLVEGRRLQLLQADGSRTFAAVHLHESRLYILEGTVTPTSPPPGLFQQSLGFVDKDGKRVRYSAIYSNAYPAPPRVPR